MAGAADPGTGHPQHRRPPRGPHAPRCCWGLSSPGGSRPLPQQGGSLSLCPPAPAPQGLAQPAELLGRGSEPRLRGSKGQTTVENGQKCGFRLDQA